MIVNYNVRQFLQQALRSVERSLRHLPHEVFVVDNNSVDGSVAMLQAEFPQVHVISNGVNVGFAKANNQAIARARGQYLWILNPDTVVEEETADVLVNFMDEHPACGAVGCRILNPDGTFALESRRAFPTLPVAFYRMTGLSRLFPYSRRFGQYNMTYLPADEVSEVDALSGSCMMVRRAAVSHTRKAFDALDAEVKVHAHQSPVENTTQHGGAGILDEGFFMYGEDLDWCYRIQQAGWRIYYTPETQIIHYKGESTKKSDLKYVRLFYGAMIRFAEKHLSDDYPRAFLWMLRVGVVARGMISAIGNALRHVALRDVALLYFVVAGLGALRTYQTQLSFPGLFYWGIAPLFALIAAATIAALGGYRGKRPRLGLLSIGVLSAVVALAAISFFVKQIAFSRAVVLASLPAGILALSALRLLPRTRRPGMRRAIVVGDPREVLRLEKALAPQEVPQFDIVGYVTTGSETSPSSDPDAPQLGNESQLREVARIHNVEDVIFESVSLSNKHIFTLMQRLAGLPVQSRILTEGHVIGKASVDHLEGAALLEAEDALGALRSQSARRLSDVVAALVGAFVHPVASVAARLTGSGSYWKALADRTRLWPDVLKGRLPLIGYNPEEVFTPPSEWQLKPGVFAVTDTLGPRLRRPREEVEQAYWYYVRNQSAVLDWIIAVRAIRTLG